MGLKKQIVQFKDGKKVAVYDSTTEAAKSIGTIKSNVSKCCLGKIKQVNGFTFKYSGKFTNSCENHGEIKCPYCEKRFETYNGLSKHIFRYKEHGEEITKEKLLADFKYNGERPRCKCGCGEYTNISFENGVHFNSYIHGHQSKIHNNWGHNKAAMLNSSETRRKQYKNGERVQWNKGKHWNETYSKDVITHLSEIHRDKMRRMLTETSFSLSSKKEKEFIDNCIKPLGFDFDTQYYLKDIKHYCDVFILSKNVIIEFQGDYWHGNPKKYPNNKLNDYQLDRVRKDEILRKYCKDNSIKLIEIWENDYDNDLNSVKSLLNEEINN